MSLFPLIFPSFRSSSLLFPTTCAKRRGNAMLMTVFNTRKLYTEKQSFHSTKASVGTCKGIVECAGKDRGTHKEIESRDDA